MCSGRLVGGQTQQTQASGAMYKNKAALCILFCRLVGNINMSGASHVLPSDAAELISRTYITEISTVLLKAAFHPWKVCFWLLKGRLSRRCPVRAIGDKCLLVIGHPTHLSSNIHAWNLGDFRGCRDTGSWAISPALGRMRRPPQTSSSGCSAEVSCSTSLFLLLLGGKVACDLWGCRGCFWSSDV